MLGDGSPLTNVTPQSHRSAAAVLAILGPESLVEKILNNWFQYLLPLHPILYRHHFFTRLAAGEANRNPEFLALVLSICAVTSSTYSREDETNYGVLTAERCVELIEDNDLLKTSTCTMDGCIVPYLMACALVRHKGFQDFRVFRTIKSAMANTQWFLFYNTREEVLHDREMAKRLYWLLATWDW